MSKWARAYVEALARGETVRFRPRGNSMRPLVDDGDLCTVAPPGDRVPARRDVVLCTVGGDHFLHLVSGVRRGQVQISNNKGHVNGWTAASNVHGFLVAREP